MLAIAAIVLNKYVSKIDRATVEMRSFTSIQYTFNLH